MAEYIERRAVVKAVNEQCGPCSAYEPDEGRIKDD